MFKVDRISIILYLVSLAMLLASNVFIKFYDELLTMLLISLALCDCIFNQTWKRYTGLWTIIGIIIFYIVYSMTYVHFNSPSYIVMDAFIESKPYIAFFTFLGISPTLTHLDNIRLKHLPIVLSIICFITLLSGDSITKSLFGHVATVGSIIYLSALTYWFSATSQRPHLCIKDKITVIIMICCGLLCTRTKYYEYFILTLFFLLIYQPGILKNLKPKHVILMLTIVVLFMVVGWSKFSYYFITGNSDTFDPNVAESYARPVLMLTGALILWDFFPFGSGLASFASYPSAANYSSLYAAYGIDNIYGISPDMPDFIMDNFYATLAQFGIVGVVLFIGFWVHAYRYLKYMLRADSMRYKALFSIGSLIICYVFIESVGNTSFTQPSGQLAMMLLGIICGQGKLLMEADNKCIQSSVNKVKII